MEHQHVQKKQPREEECEDSDGDDDEKPLYFPLTRLPKEILQHRLVPYLGPRDALNLSQSSKTLHSNLTVSVLRPPVDMFYELRWTGSVDQGDTVRCGFRLRNVYNKNVRSHSVCFDCTWRDQGEGECKGEAWIKEFLSESKTCVRDVAHARLESHDPERLTMTFSPVKGMMYRFFYKVGGGGGHELFFTNGRLHSLIYDDQSRSLSKMHPALRANGALMTVRYRNNMGGSLRETVDAYFNRAADAATRFLRRILLANCQMLLRQTSSAEERGIVKASSQEVTAVLEEQLGIHLDESSLKAMEMLLREDIVTFK